MWNSTRYERLKNEIESTLTNDTKKPYTYMQEYKKAITDEDYEKAKAITEALKPLNYDTKDTHTHIACLWN